MDGGNGTAVLTLGGSCLADFSNGALVNAGSLDLATMGNLLVILPAGFSQGFAPSSRLGVVYTRGTVLSRCRPATASPSP